MLDGPTADPSQLVAVLRRARDGALGQRAAIDEVLQIINSSLGNLAPAFDALLEKAARRCNTNFGHLQTYVGECLHAAVVRNPASYVAWMQKRGPVKPPPGVPRDRLLRAGLVVHIPDIREEFTEFAVCLPRTGRSRAGQTPETDQTTGRAA